MQSKNGDLTTFKYVGFHILSSINRFIHLHAAQVAKSIRIVMTSRLASIVVTLDMERIQVSQLYINSQIVKESILQTPKIKLKEQVLYLSGIKSCLRFYI